MERSKKKRRYDETMLAVVLILVVIGLVLLYSTSAYNGRVKFHDPLYYLKKQGFRMTALDLEPAGPEVEEGDMRSLLLPEECFDFCLAECSVSVCGDGDAALKEAYRVLKKGGVFLLSDVFFRQENAPALSMKRPLTLACWQEAFTEAGFRQEAFRDETAAWKEFFLECLWNGSAGPESQEFFREAGRAGCGYFLTCLRKGGRRDGYI